MTDATQGQEDEWPRKRDAISASPPSSNGDVERKVPAPSAAKGKTRGQALQELLPGTWKIETRFLGRKEVNYWWFRSDGTIGRSSSGQVEGTWQVTDGGRLSVKGKKHVIFEFSVIEPGSLEMPHYLAGRVRFVGSILSQSILSQKSVWTRPFP